MPPAYRTSSMPNASAFRTVVLALLIALPLVGCAMERSGGATEGARGSIDTGTAPPPPDMATPAADASGRPLVGQPAVAALPGATPGRVDDSCTTDADCAVKNVGNCCGYYPACVNKNSPTFPEQVKAECAKNDMQSVCGFRDIASCQCVDGRCSALDAGEGPAR